MMMTKEHLGCRGWAGGSLSVFARLIALMLLTLSLFIASALQAHEIADDSGHETSRGPRSVADLAEQLIPAVVNISTISHNKAKGALPLPKIPEGSPFRKFFEDHFEDEDKKIESKDSKKQTDQNKDEPSGKTDDKPESPKQEAPKSQGDAGGTADAGDQKADKSGKADVKGDDVEAPVTDERSETDTAVPSEKQDADDPTARKPETDLSEQQESQSDSSKQKTPDNAKPETKKPEKKEVDPKNTESEKSKPKTPKPERKKSTQSLGSGFVIDALGLIVTNNHVISGADTINVKFNDGTSLEAKIIGRDTKTDLALLKVDADGPLATVSFGGAEQLRVGDWVMAIGNPFGLGGSVSVGIVSARNRDINTGPFDNFIQTDAAINRGNSGGPLFDMYGHVVGVNTAIISPTGASIGLGFAIPADIAKWVTDQLEEYGETRRGWLGVRVQDVTKELAEGLGLDDVAGAFISWVNEEGPARAAGLKVGDVIMAYNGIDVGEVRDLTRLVADTQSGTKIVITVIREGQPADITVEIGRLAAEPEVEPAPVDEDLRKNSMFGMKLSRLSRAERRKHNLTDRVEGVVLKMVEPNSLAAQEGIRSGMVIVEIDQEIVSTPQDVITRIEQLKSQGKKTIVFLLAKPDGDELVFVPFHVN